MKKEHFLTVIVSLVIISGVIILSACASVAAVGQTSSIEAQVNTAVAATMIQYMVETQVAAQSMALALPSAGQEQATQPPAPTPTPLPPEPAQPTIAPTVAAPQPTATPPPSPTAPPPAPAGPKITADQTTNCRVGPSTVYTVDAYFMEGMVSTVEGKDQYEDWWYIVSPDDTSENCWVWEGSTTVQGDTSTVQVVAAPSGVQPKASNSYYVYNVYKPYYYPYSCPNYSSYCCGKTVCCGKVVTCKPNKKNCVPYPWWTCNPNVNCTCKPVYQNPCWKGGCPPVTEVNYKNYCKNYPQCCNEKD